MIQAPPHLVLVFLFVLSSSVLAQVQRPIQINNYTITVFAEIKAELEGSNKLNIENCRAFSVRIEPKTSNPRYVLKDKKGNEVLRAYRSWDTNSLYLDKTFTDSPYYIFNREDTVAILNFKYINPKIYRTAMVLNEKKQALPSVISLNYLSQHSLLPGILDVLNQDTAICPDHSRWMVNGQNVGRTITGFSFKEGDSINLIVSPVGKCVQSFPCEDIDTSSTIFVTNVITNLSRYTDVHVTSMFPNPVTNFVIFNSTKFNYQIKDVQGQVLKKDYSEDGVIPVGDLNRGVYFIENNGINFKIFKE